MKTGRGGPFRKQGKQEPSSQQSGTDAATLDGLLARARAHHKAGQLGDAEKLYREILQAVPEHPDALNLLGVIASQVGQTTLALELIDRAIAARPGFMEAYFSRGNALYAVERYQQAVESFDKVIQLSPQYAEAHNNRGGALHALERYEAALESFDKALLIRPDYADASHNRGNALHDFTQQQAALYPPVKTESSGRDVVFYCGPTDEVWNPETARTKGIGGSEEAVIWLSRLLEERGWNVTVYGNCGAAGKEYDGVWWKPYWMWNHRDRQDVTVIWRYPQLLKHEINSAKVVLDLHDTLPEKELTAERVERVYRIFVKSRFHRSLYPSIADEKFAVVPNGIDAKLFEGNGNRDPMLLINTSSADRSMEAFVDCFAEIKQQVPGAKAQWAYGWGVWDAEPTVRAQRQEWKAKMQARMGALGIEELGRISHGEIAALYQKANIFAYPTEHAEIDCISLSKAMAAGAIPITTDFAALGEKAGHGGVFLHSKKTKDDWIQPGQFHFEITDPEQKAQFVREAVKLLRKPATEQEREPMRAWARATFDWNTIADAWEEVLKVEKPAGPGAAAVVDLLERGSGHHRAGQLAEAEALYREVLQISPEHADALHLLGLIAYQVGEAGSALDLIDRAIAARADFAEAYFSRGNALFALERYQAAVESFDKTIQLNPHYAEAHNNRGGALQALERYEEAVESYDRAVGLKPDYVEARRNHSNALLSWKQQQAGASLPTKTESSGRDLVFYCAPTDEVWNPQTAQEKGIGGSEEAVIWLSRLLRKRGWKVTVYCNCGAEERNYDGVWWKPCWMWNSRDRQDVTVIWRHPQLTQYEINSEKVILDLHDAFPEGELTAERLQRIYKIFVKSAFHRSLYPHISDEKFVIVPNGIDARLFDEEGNRDPMLLINTSSADRSMEAFLDCFEEVKKEVPGVKAHWAYGWGVWDSDFSLKTQRTEWKARMQGRMQGLGVEELGRISHAEIAALYRKASIFAYPSEYAEIDCISLSKAMAAGAIPITTDFAAMGEKAGHGGVFLHSKKTKDDWLRPDQFHFGITDPEQKAEFVREAVKLLRNPASEEERKSMREWARSTFDWDAIADRWQEVLESRPPEPVRVEDLLEKARAHHAAGQLAEAEAVYRQILKTSSDHSVTLNLLGAIAYQAGKYEVAVGLIERAIEGNPGNAEAYFNRGNALYALERYAEAVESYRQAIELSPRHAEAHNNRGSALYALGQYREALESYGKAVDLKPDYADAHSNRGFALHGLGEYRAAVESYDQAIRLQPEAEAYYLGRGNALHAGQQYLAALESYDKAIELNPLNAEAHNNRGSALHALEQYEEALASYDKAIELRADYADAQGNRENTQRALQQYVFFRPDYEYEQERKVFAAAAREVRRIAEIGDKAQMKAELDALPLAMRSHPAVSSLRNLNFVKAESSGKDLVFYCSPPNETWNPETARTKGVGGSEEAVIWLSRLLHERGWKVTVYGNCGVEEKEYDGVLWKPYWMWNWRDKQDVTVLWRYPQHAKYEINSDAVVVDLHDVVFESELPPERLKRIDKIFVKSRFHRSLYPAVADEKFVIIPNGIDAKLFEGGGERDPRLLINTSSGDRSMEAFLDCFAEIKQQVPDAKAQWAYGWGVWDFSNQASAEKMEWKQQIQARMQALGVEDRGRLSHGEVAELYREGNVFAYPSEMAEIDCISLSKAMAAGAIPITTDFGALGEKRGHGGVFIHSKKTKDDWIEPGQFHFEMTDPEQKERFVEEAVRLLKNPPSEQEREPMREWARSTFDWNAIADAWNEALGALQRSANRSANRTTSRPGRNP
ncbi:MAG: tetratricopeptide repeat protein [Acidobacteriaceae bacterium]|jgi:tetratricopeptide (TPR) repeat protein